MTKPRTRICFLLAAGPLLAEGWSITEAHYQGGRARSEHAVSPPGFQHILTLQHASGWKRVEN